MLNSNTHGKSTRKKEQYRCSSLETRIRKEFKQITAVEREIYSAVGFLDQRIFVIGAGLNRAVVSGGHVTSAAPIARTPGPDMCTEVWRG